MKQVGFENGRPKHVADEHPTNCASHIPSGILTAIENDHLILDFPIKNGDVP